MNEQLERKRIELQILFQQLTTLQNQIGALHNQIEEMNSLAESLEEVEKTKADTEILVPLGAGIFVNARITNTDEVLMNVGSKVAVPKTVKESCAIVRTQVKELEKVLLHLENEFQSYSARAQEMQSEMQGMLEADDKK